jgi:hypothetical protein
MKSLSKGSSILYLSLFLATSFSGSFSINIQAAGSETLNRNSKVPMSFRDSDNSSPYQIRYDDYSALLELVVFDTGRSFREKAPRIKAKVGTRLKSRRKVNTVMEGNRVNYAEINKAENLEIVRSIRKSIESVPAEVSLSLLNDKEQLAYWINLYNITVIEQVAQLYPTNNIEDELYDDDGVMQQKLLKVDGIDLSLNDIHHNIIVEKFGYNNLVMYGLYQGVVGGPNIRPEAYTGEQIYQQLQDNAEEFINSNRGTFDDDMGGMRVSSFYAVNNRLFVDFDEDLRKHLALYADSNYQYPIQNADRFTANISDMTLNDIFGSEKIYGGSNNTNVAPLLNSEGPLRGRVSDLQRIPGSGILTGPAVNHFPGLGEQWSSKSTDSRRYSPELLKMLMKMRNRGKLSNSEVSVKEDESHKGTSQDNEQ